MQRITMNYSSQTLVRQTETTKNAKNNKLKRKSNNPPSKMLFLVRLSS